MSPLDLESIGLTREQAAKHHRNAVAGGRTKLDIASPSAAAALSRTSAAVSAPRGDEPRVHVGVSHRAEVHTCAPGFAGGYDIAQIGTLDADRLFVPSEHSLAPVYVAPVSVADVPRDKAVRVMYSRMGGSGAISSRSRAREVEAIGGRVAFTLGDATIVATRTELIGVVDLPGGRSTVVTIGQLNAKRDGWDLLGAL